LGCSGILTTLTAASDFPHKYVTNLNDGAFAQSGTLSEKAIVTQAEMIEHSFYQLINLFQAIYLHLMHQLTATKAPLWMRYFLLWLVTAPWIFRTFVPVNSFSHNWKIFNERRQSREHNMLKTKSEAKVCATLEVFLYRIKKTQYIFYKHCILHGVNITMMLSRPALHKIPHSRAWRTFWILLNSSYVMEFFLQTMVKRKILSQATMLRLNVTLMIASSLGALFILNIVPVWICALSVVLNFVHRHHDVVNTLGIALFAAWVADQKDTSQIFATAWVSNVDKTN
jgi:hypothetical protein